MTTDLTERLRELLGDWTVACEAADTIERQAAEIEMWKEVGQAHEANYKYMANRAAEQKKEVERLQQVCRDTYEVWAGSEGIPEPICASEAYLLSLVEQMRDEAKKGLG